MDRPTLIPVIDVVVKTGEYEKDGKTRNRYKNIGTLFARSAEGADAIKEHSFTIKLDALPNSGEGWLALFPREKAEKSGYEKAKEARAKLDPEAQSLADSLPDEEEISLSDIPF